MSTQVFYNNPSSRLRLFLIPPCVLSQGNQDGGEGNLGTVIDLGKQGSLSSPDKTVVVQWDAGTKTNYRVGYQGAYDLRVS